MKFLKHIAFAMDGLNENPEKAFGIISDFIDLQVNENILILTFYILPEGVEKDDKLFSFLGSLSNFFNGLKDDSILHDNKIKISVLGKWYDLPERFLEPIKKIVTDTKDYDGFFVNFCINYSGKGEIVEAAKSIARQVKLEKLDPEAINEEMIKENLYSSGILPPDIIIVNNKKKNNLGLLLWDSVDSEIFYIKKQWLEMTQYDFLKIIDYFRTG